MRKKKSDIGVIGLSVMGRNLAYNIAERQYKVSLYNRTSSVLDEVLQSDFHKNFVPCYELKDFVEGIEKPRKIIMMIKAGEAVDLMIEQLLPFLEEGDNLIDGGNSFFEDTQRRYEYLKKKSVHYFGVGISGGEEGARTGPAIMPGGDSEVYHSHIRKILEDISAKVEGNPCCCYTSSGGAGHYVKMVHNGIEYGDMQLISEIYLMLNLVGGCSNDEMHRIFKKWNEVELESYLIQITANILKVKEKDSYLLDLILDKASQKGTGKWMSLQAIELGINTSVITTALNSRYMSNLKADRMKAEVLFKNKKPLPVEEKEAFIELSKNSLFLAKIISYSQGFQLLKAAEKEYHWDFDFSGIARIFRGGCIIQAKFLDQISDAFSRNKNLENLLFDSYFSEIVKRNQEDLRKLVILAVQNGVPVPALSSALSYLDEYSTARGGAHLIQAQRDYFGAHTFERIDKDGAYHFDWVNENGK